MRHTADARYKLFTVSALNLEFIRSLQGLYRARGTAVVSVGLAASRKVYISAGDFVGADSSNREEWLGAILSQAGLLDAALIGPVGEEAKRKQRLFGEQLLADGLIDPAQLAAAIHRQATTRFEKTFTTPGPVKTDFLEPPRRPGVRSDIGALTLAAYRAALPIDLVMTLTATLERGYRMSASTTALERLALAAAEFRICRRLSANEPWLEITQGPSGELAHRVAGALYTVGLLTTVASATAPSPTRGWA